MNTTDRINRILDNAPGWIKSLFDHNRFLAVSLIGVCILVSFAGCQPKAISPISGKMMTKIEFDAELAVEVAKTKARVEELNLKAAVFDKQIEAQVTAINAGLSALSGFIQTMPGPWTGLANSALGIITVGLGADNLRKGSIIRKTKGLR